MSEEIIEEAVASETVKKARKPRAAKKPAETVVETPKVVAAEETTVTDEGQTVISSASKPSRAPRKSNTKMDENNVIGSNAADYALKDAPKPSAPKAKEKASEDKVALWSDRNIRWSEVGAVAKGYNIVTKEAAEKWLRQRGVREATPEEVATYYGK